MPKRLFISLITLWVFCMCPGPALSETSELTAAQQDTMLMFVGEDMEALSIASRREESVWEAPAVANVITRKELWDRGVQTLGQGLDMLPGFYMAQKEWGTQPYLRGIPESVLFLYGAVPLNSDISKSMHPLDHDLSLAPVKQVEVIRGPGSVLWGPDAFAGIVNVVPLTGKDLDGVETGVLYEAPGDQGAVYANMGRDGGDWDGFLSVSARGGEEDDTTCNVVRFWGDDKAVSPLSARLGDEKPGRSRYLDLSGNFSFRDWFTFSGLVSDNRKPYAISGHTPEDLTWREERDTTYGHVKLDAERAIDRASGLRFMGYYSWYSPSYEIIDRTFKQKERTLYGELLYDRSFMSGQGFLTAGISYRKKQVRDALVWLGYFPDYVAQKYTDFLPRMAQESYDDGLWSALGQYTHKIGSVDLWLGLRYDRHDEYKTHLSYNAGVGWSPLREWMFKLQYGTAYRTPFASQLLKEDEPELENIKTLSAQASWKPSRMGSVSACLFFSRLNNHRMEDPYAGLSLPNRQDIKGIELEGRFAPFKTLEFSGNLTLMDNSGPDETYRYVKYWTPEPEYETRNFPYDSGPRSLLNLMGTWRPLERLTTFLRLRYFSSRQLIYPRADTFRTYDNVWLLDMSATVKDVLVPGLDVQFSIENLLNNHYQDPGTYSTIEGEPITAQIVLRKRW